MRKLEQENSLDLEVCGDGDWWTALTGCRIGGFPVYQLLGTSLYFNQKWSEKDGLRGEGETDS